MIYFDDYVCDDCAKFAAEAIEPLRAEWVAKKRAHLVIVDVASGQSASQSPGDVHALVQALPCFITQIVISHRGACSPTAGATPIGDTADIAFGIRVQPLSDQQSLIDDIRAQINPPGGPAPPPGRGTARSQAPKAARPSTPPIRLRSAGRAAAGRRCP